MKQQEVIFDDACDSYPCYKRGPLTLTRLCAPFIVNVVSLFDAACLCTVAFPTDYSIIGIAGIPLPTARSWCRNSAF